MFPTLNCFKLVAWRLGHDTGAEAGKAEAQKDMDTVAGAKDKPVEQVSWHTAVNDVLAAIDPRAQIHCDKFLLTPQSLHPYSG